MKVAVIFHRFGPYHCARLEAASRRCTVVGIELGSETPEYQWSKVEQPHAFERVTLFAHSDSRTKPVNELEECLRDALSASRPDAVSIPGWSDKGALAALRWCLRNGVPAVLMSESTVRDESRVWWKELVKRRIISLCSAALVGGQRHKEYLTKLGMDADRVFTGYDVVDNGYFAQGAKEARGRRSEVGDLPQRIGPLADKTSEVSKKHGLPENYFLASARFVPKKNLVTLIRAYAEYRQESEIGGQRSEIRPVTSDIWSLVILGDGPLKSDLRRLISDLGLHDNVVMPGFKQYDELPVYYGLANAFVHASSSEQWGLVVNEAIASGLPVIVSKRCGCVPELVREGVNGFTFDPDDQAQLTSLLLALSTLPRTEREQFSQASVKIADQNGLEQFGQGLERAARGAMAQPAKSLSLLDRIVLNRLMHQ